MANFLSNEKFRELARDNKAEDAALRKQYLADVKVHDDTARELLFTISTSSVDRHGDKVSVDGWRLDNYRKNPVVLWAHSYDGFPIAKSNKIWTEDGKLKSIASFVPADNSAVGRQAEGIYQLYKGGFLSATSVGFMPVKWAWTEDKDRKYGIDFEEQELLEYSAVPVPANAEALIEARGLGVDVEPVMEWARQVLMPKEIKDIRNFENFLRESGFSRKDAVLLASHGWVGLSQRESEIAECVKGLQQFRDSLR